MVIPCVVNILVPCIAVVPGTLKAVNKNGAGNARSVDGEKGFLDIRAVLAQLYGSEARTL